MQRQTQFGVISPPRGPEDLESWKLLLLLLMLLLLVATFLVWPNKGCCILPARLKDCCCCWKLGLNDCRGGASTLRALQKRLIRIIIFDIGTLWQSLALSRRLELWDVPLFLLANPAWTEESEPDKSIHLYSPLCLKVWLAMNWA